MHPFLLKIFFLSMTPLGELRVGIPYGLYNEVNPVLTYLIAVAGNMLPVVFLLWGLVWFEKMIDKLLLRNSNYVETKTVAFLQKSYLWYKNRTERKYSKIFTRLGALALIIFVAVPLPVTGAWTGALAANIFAVPPKKALLLILAGVMIAGLIVLAISWRVF